MTQSAGFRGRKMATAAMRKADALYGSYLRETEDEPVRTGMTNKDANSQSEHPPRTLDSTQFTGRNR